MLLLLLQLVGSVAGPSECRDCCGHHRNQAGCHGLHHLDVFLPTSHHEPQVLVLSVSIVVLLLLMYKVCFQTHYCTVDSMMDQNQDVLNHMDIT